MGGCCSGNSDKEEGDKYGTAKQFDPSFKGPIKNRSCTDILCCLIFFVFILGYLVIAIFAWLNGDPIILLYPTDSQGRICGVKYTDLDLSGKTNLFYFDITRCTSAATVVSFQCPTTQICVSSCPTEYWTYYPDLAMLTAAEVANPGNRQAALAASGIDLSKYICEYGFNITDEYINNGRSLLDIVRGEKCASYTVQYEPVVGRCIPLVSETLGILNSTAGVIRDANGNNVTSTNLAAGVDPIQWFLQARSIADKIFADLTISWYWLLIMLGVAAVVAFVWIVLMRWIAGAMVWITLLGLIGVLSFGVWYCYDEWNRLATVEGADTSIISVGFTTNLDTYLALRDTWLAFLIILSVLDAIIILVVIFLRKRILIAVQVIRQASKAVGAMISTLFYPLATFVLCVVVVSFWAATALFLASTGDPVYEFIDARNASTIAADPAGNLTGQTCNLTAFAADQNLSYNGELKCEFIEYGGASIFHQNVVWLQVISAFGMLWMMNWVLALGQCTLAGAFSSYYWAWKKPDDIPFFPLYSSFGRTLRYHTGSIAFGAFIIAVVQLIRLMLEYIDHKLKGKENKVAKFILCCLKCCFWCLENVLKFLNRNAYIMISVYGKNFCWSAKEAFKLLMRNILRTVVLDKVTDFLLFVGKLIVTAGMGALAWAFFTNKFASIQLLAPALNYYWMLIIIVIVSTYFIASGFFNTFGMAIDTIFLCFLEDLERHDGTPEKPYYMSKGLMKVLGKKNKKPKTEG